MIKLSEDARKTLLTWAAEEAKRRGDRRLGTDHLLLALLHDPDSGPARALGVDLESARAASDALDRAALTAVGIDAGPLDLPPRQVRVHRLPPLTSGARAVLKRTVEETRGARVRRIQTQHFLLALLTRDRPDPAAELLAALRVDPSQVRARLTGPRN